MMVTYTAWRKFTSEDVALSVEVCNRLDAENKYWDWGAVVADWGEDHSNQLLDVVYSAVIALRRNLSMHG